MGTAHGPTPRRICTSGRSSVQWARVLAGGRRPIVMNTFGFEETLRLANHRGMQHNQLREVNCEPGGRLGPFQAVMIQIRVISVPRRRRNRLLPHRTRGDGRSEPYQAERDNRIQGERRDPFSKPGFAVRGFPDERHSNLLLSVGCRQTDFSCRLFRSPHAGERTRFTERLPLYFLYVPDSR